MPDIDIDSPLNALFEKYSLCSGKNMVRQGGANHNLGNHGGVAVRDVGRALNFLYGETDHRQMIPWNQA